MWSIHSRPKENQFDAKSNLFVIFVKSKQMFRIILLLMKGLVLQRAEV